MTTIEAAPIIPTDTVVWPVLTELASCLCAQITDSGLPEPCFCGIYPGGPVPYEYCDGCEDGACGQAWVRLSQGFMSAAFPTPDLRATCRSPLAFTVEVGIIRCAPTTHDDGSPPTLTEYMDAAQLQMADMGAMRRAIICCTAAMRHREHVLQSYNPVGPLGGCVGGVWTVVFSE